MNYFYTEEGLSRLNIAKKKIVIFLVVSLVLLLVTFGLFIYFATYKTRTLTITLCSISTTIETFFIIFFSLVNRYYKRIIADYVIIKDGKHEKTIVEFIDISEKPITLSDKSMAYVLKVKNKKGNQTLYLHSIFPNDVFVPGNKYKIEIIYDYIVGYEDEH